MTLRHYLVAIGLCAGLGAASVAQSQTPDLASLRDALHLTPGQQSAWAAYAASATVPADAQQRRRSAAAIFPTLPAPRRIALVQAEMQREMDDLHRQAQALDAFYAVLTPDQQRTFDAQTLPPDREAGH